MITIRAARVEDDGPIAALLIRTFKSLYARMGVEMSADRERYLEDQPGRRAYAITFVCVEDDEVLATVTLVPPSTRSEAWVTGAWDLRLLAVDDRMHGRGIASELLAAAERQAVNTGATAMCLHARRGVENQARLYIASGYVRDQAGDIDGEPFQEGYRKDL